MLTYIVYSMEEKKKMSFEETKQIIERERKIREGDKRRGHKGGKKMNKTKEEVGEGYKIYVGAETNRILKENAEKENMPMEAYISHILFHFSFRQSRER